MKMFETKRRLLCCTVKISERRNSEVEPDEEKEEEDDNDDDEKGVRGEVKNKGRRTDFLLHTGGIATDSAVLSRPSP